MNLQNSLKKIPYLSAVSAVSRKKKLDIWLVGGFLRDNHLKLKKDFVDFDFCVEKDVLAVVKEFSKKISSKFIVLDREQGSFRVILKKKGKFYTYDFSKMRGEDFKSDLSLRDFTINTLAVNLRIAKPKLIDLFGAKRDLSRKIIRVVNEEVLFDDALRILRGFSFMVNYGFRIEVKTLRAMAKFKRFLKNVSGERINEELFKMLSCERSYYAFKKMDELRILDEIIPYVSKARGVYQGKFHHLDVWPHSLETLRQFELIYRRLFKNKKEVAAYLNQELAQGRKRIQVLKLACLLHDIGKPRAKRRKQKRTIFHTHEKIGREMSEEIARRLRLSLKETEVLKKLVFWHLRPGYLADQKIPSRRAGYRFFRDTGEEGVSVIILSLSDWRATRGPLIDMTKRKGHERVMLKLISGYFLAKANRPLPVLVDGYDIMRKFSLQPSALIGDILRKIKEEQALGKISTRSEAYQVARKVVEKKKKTF